MVLLPPIVPPALFYLRKILCKKIIKFKNWSCFWTAPHRCCFSKTYNQAVQCWSMDRRLFSIFQFCRWNKKRRRKRISHARLHVVAEPTGNQIYLVTLRPRELTQASFLQKNQTLQNVFLISVTLRWHIASVPCKNQSLWSWLFWFFM